MNNKYLILILLFGIIYNNVNSQVDITFPKQDYLFVDTTVNFQWNSNYNINLLISNNYNFTNIKLDTIISNQNEFEYNNFSFGDTNYIKIRSINDTIWSNTISFSFFNPTMIDGLCFFIDPNKNIITENDSIISQVTDCSTNNIILNSEATLAGPKIIEDFSEQSNILFFNNNNNILFTNNLVSFKTLYAIASYESETNFPNYNGIITQIDNTGGSSESIIFIGTSNSTDLYGGNIFNNNITINNTLTNNFSQLNDLKIIKGYSPSLKNINGIIIGRDRTSTDRSWYGFIGDIIAFDRELTTSENNIINKYYQYKYSPPVNLGNDIYTDSCTIELDSKNSYKSLLWSTNDTTKKIQVNGPGKYWVTAIDYWGNISYDTINISFPYSIINDTLICSQDTITWNLNLNNTMYTYTWSDNSTNGFNNINQEGNYWVTIQNINSCSQITDTVHITIDNYPITTSLGNDTSLCSGQNLYLQIGASETTNYLWSTGSTNDNITINTAGEYSVTTTNTIACVATDTINIQIHGNAPVPGFDFANTCFNDNTVFTDTSYTSDNSNIISWNWDFGNGDTSNLQNPELQFADTGIFSVSLIVLTDSNCTNLIMKNIEIHSLPISNYTNTQLCQETSINFSNLSTIPKGNIISYYWDFGNSDFSTDTNPTYTYTNYGYYDLQLISTSDFNCKDTLKQHIEIKPSPIADFLTSATCRNKVISFYNNSSSLPYNPVYETHWDFGDGTISDGENPNYLFDGSDTIYNVSFEIKSINGCRNSIVKQIQLYNNPKANFTNDKICAETYTQLLNNSIITNDTITSYVWQIENNFYYDENPTIFFGQAGQTNISLTSTSTHGCSDNIQKHIPILELPNPDFDIVPKWGITNEYTVFTSQNEGDNFWDLGNGVTATDSVSYTIYPDSGMYVIEHIIVDSNNCVDTIFKDYRVVIPQNDIAITELRYTINNGILSAEADIINIGNLPINKIKFTLSPDGYSSISEIWEGEFIYGSGMTYIFNANIQISENKTPNYICVIADITDKYTDTNPSNNTYCTNNNNSVLYPIYPNPTSDFINISFNLDHNSMIRIELFDNLGKQISLIDNKEYQKGFHKLTYNVSKLNEAVYSVKLSIDNKSEIIKFIKN